MIPVYGSGDVPGQAAFEILIGGVARNVPLFLDTEPGSRAIVLVSEDTFLQVMAQQLYMDGEPGLHHVSLRGMCADAGETERISRECIGGQQQVEGFVVNHEESLRRQETVGAGLQFLCAAFIVLLSAAAVCGDFTVSWAVQMSRKGEYAVLSSIGMKPEEIQKMRCWELLFQGFCRPGRNPGRHPLPLCGLACVFRGVQAGLAVSLARGWHGAGPTGAADIGCGDCAEGTESTWRHPHTRQTTRLTSIWSLA